MSAENNNTSTLQSYIDSATGAAQSLLGSVTGSTADQQQGENKKAEGEAKGELSHSAAKIGGVTATPEGGVASDDARRSEGSWNQTMGSAKAAVGGLVGSQNLKQQGERQNEEGKAQEAEGQLSDLGKGAADRLQGAVGGAVAGLTGDKEGQAHYKSMHDDGKAQQRGAEIDIQKQGPQ